MGIRAGDLSFYQGQPKGTYSESFGHMKKEVLTMKKAKKTTTKKAVKAKKAAKKPAAKKKDPKRVAAAKKAWKTRKAKSKK
ncbi:MAG: hypothetical protein EHM87_23115 [Burkholderiales bacterium]|nr:MAG: hypothetical protein EHM87_23115 [Burkholderiales bacterium]